MMSDSIGGIYLQYPWMVASGVLGTTVSLINRLVHCNLGAVVTKSIGPTARLGYPNPTVIGLPGDLKGSLLNAVGLSNPGVSEFKRECEKIDSQDIPVIASVFGADADEISEVVETLDNTQIACFEVNLSCPHGGKYGLALGTVPKTVTHVIEVMKDSTRKPVWAKLTPNVTDIVAIGQAAEEGGADAVVAVNTLQALAVDIWARKLVLSHGVGGLSGSCLRPVALRCVKQLYDNLDIPVIGVGGIGSWKNVAEFMLVGASAVQIGSALHECKPELFFSQLSHGFEEYLRREGFSKARELVGLALGF